MRSRTRGLKTFWVGIVSTSFSFDATAGLTLTQPAEKGGRLVPGNQVPLCPIEAGGVSAEAGFGAEHAVERTIRRRGRRFKTDTSATADVDARGGHRNAPGDHVGRPGRGSLVLLETEALQDREDLVEEVGQAAQWRTAVEEVGDRTQEVPEEVPGGLLSGDVELDLVQVDHEAKEIKVQWPEREVQDVAGGCHC